MAAGTLHQTSLHRYVGVFTSTGASEGISLGPVVSFPPVVTEGEGVDLCSLCLVRDGSGMSSSFCKRCPQFSRVNVSHLARWVLRAGM